MNLKNSNNRNIQINCVRDNVVAGEDGSIKVGDEYLPYATDTQGWLIEIDDVYAFELFSTKENKILRYVLIISPSGVIGLYFFNKNWTYKILQESSECYYNIKEATIVASLLSLYVDTEFSGLVQLSYDLNHLM